MDIGTLRHLPDGYEVRWERHLPQRSARVWRALTEGRELRAWFPAAIEGDWSVGSRLRFSFDDDRGGDEAEAAEEPDHPDHWGEVVGVDEPHRLVFTWHRDVLAFDLRDDEDGCVLVLTTTTPGREHLCRDATGWHACLEALAAHLHGEVDDVPPLERWRIVHPRYEQAFGPDPVPHVPAP